MHNLIHHINFPIYLWQGNMGLLNKVYTSDFTFNSFGLKSVNSSSLTICHILLHLPCYCNDLFSRFEQQIFFLEKLAETTDPTTDSHGHDEPSRGSHSKTLRILKFGY